MKPALRKAELNVLNIIKSEIKSVEHSLQEVEDFYKKDLRRLDRLSDRIAQIGGSWDFILLFFIVLFSWMILNSWILAERAFDAFPFILLNLILSCVAAIQAPIILMAQNRGAKRDQARLEMDLEKDLRDLHVDEASHKLLLRLKQDMEKVKKKLKVK